MPDYLGPDPCAGCKLAWMDCEQSCALYCVYHTKRDLLERLKGEGVKKFRQQLRPGYYETYSLHATPNPDIPIELGWLVWVGEDKP
jgi:hypothetical protein